ncbi:hypothetical protein BGZ54_003728, partial [Gamsiella multidivaricata]
SNLPPFYVDHALDPVCIYEHELPPDVVPPVRPILVHSPSEDSASVENPTENTETSSAGISTERASSLASGPQEEPLATQLSFQTSPGLPSPAVLASSSHSITPSSIRTAPSPRILDQETLNLARLPAPPSYDVPNRVVDRSPLTHPRYSHHHSHSASDAQTMMLSPMSAAGRGAPDDYFGHHVRTRAHTISSSQPYQPHGAQVGGEGELPPTPRYSLEFSPDIPHQLHLEEHQRGRALYAASLSSMSHSRLSLQDPETARIQVQAQYEAIRLQDRSHSQPSYHTPTFVSQDGASSSSIMEEGRQGQGQRQRQRRPGVRTRASTFGESSKLLIQRMQVALLRKNVVQQQQQQQQQDLRVSGEESSSNSRAEGSGQVVNLQQQLELLERSRLGGVGLGIHQAPEQQQEPEETGDDTSEEAETENSGIVIVVEGPESPEEQAEDGAMWTERQHIEPTMPQSDASTHMVSTTTTGILGSMPMDSVSVPVAVS